ncbi:hypothetical protein HDV00_001805 [Rhizophlyctis rosea]|nr:hypothetical protein HDV00_001805 [Rhizophlyctis rosea]
MRQFLKLAIIGAYLLSQLGSTTALPQGVAPASPASGTTTTHLNFKEDLTDNPIFSRCTGQLVGTVTSGRLHVLQFSRKDNTPPVTGYDLHLDLDYQGVKVLFNDGTTGNLVGGSKRSISFTVNESSDRTVSVDKTFLQQIFVSPGQGKVSTVTNILMCTILNGEYSCKSHRMEQEC